MKNFSNKYMLLYALGLAAIVALVLTVVSVSLKPLQTRNQQAETKQMILKTIGIEASLEDADKLYSERIEEAKTNAGLPYYNYDNGIIIPLNGNGLWGPIWGYIALGKDLSVVGAIFDHKGETPGLGGEIATDNFAQRFIGKEWIDQPIVLKKNADKGNTHEVDAISGGTMTSNGVTEMLAKAFKEYSELFESWENCQAIAEQTKEEE
ncbi:MAG: FMN-binding protein [Bacteroidales bacterium]|nr:FMN-binding protein [Bacteroidales bacterium]